MWNPAPHCISLHLPSAHPGPAPWLLSAQSWTPPQERRCVFLPSSVLPGALEHVVLLYSLGLSWLQRHPPITLPRAALFAATVYLGDTVHMPPGRWSPLEETLCLGPGRGL